MDFKYPYLRKQWALLHPEVCKAINDLDVWLTTQGLPVMTLTHIYRTPQEQELFYWKSVMDDLKCTEQIARDIARKKFSWHRAYCAVDIRNTNFGPLDRTKIFKQLKAAHATDRWEILMHDVGRGDHFHVGYRDTEWKHRWSNQLKA